MDCPKCHDMDMEKIMDEATGVWFRCTKCKFELVYPDITILRDKSKYSF